ncbi:hypothetical protein DZF92_13155 [Clavibacter michiganensis subsp. insidiosus]|nr:hypothetical protein [Clavibacter michiganensis]AWG01805.1 hypothetical protein BEH62_09400 [Clavibacter michiganensis subsp. insidiosus]OQJ59687.1 hypothetical protein B5P21_07010 [Clavibacter michiganensis subsp. insidiosus]RII85739.1 hypothetical protein DZF92_13155 [Clavibacter michiganensis subsp. insidiosus]RMC83987.1 hypothetical protein CmiCFBP2404_13045 [Clavibacter michiganensis subsp. insidiosus]
MITAGSPAEVAAWVVLCVLATASLVLALLAVRSPGTGTVAGSAAALGAAVVLGLALEGLASPLVVGYLGLVAVVLAVLGGGSASTVVLALATRGSVPPGAYGGILVPPRGHEDDPSAIRRPTREVLRGGATIGMLERLAVVAVLLAGYPEALAVVIAIKGVGRFSELGEAAEARERFIIGTLVSWLWAATCAAVVLVAR